MAYVANAEDLDSVDSESVSSGWSDHSIDHEGYVPPVFGDIDDDWGSRNDEWRVAARENPLYTYGMTEEHFKQVKKKKQNELNEKLSKRLMYLLRYGAVQEGLTVQSGGYVEVKSLMKVPLMRHNTEEEVLAILDQALSYRGTPRFEKKETSGGVYIRARYGQRMERNHYHEGTKVTKLLDTCLGHICENISDYDFEGFPDLFLLNAIMHKLKRDHKLSNNALRTILNPSIDHLDLEGIYVTPGSLRILGDRCPNLQVLSLRGCGYVLNDHYMEQLFKNLNKLHSLNISGCHHITDRTLEALGNTNPDLTHLNASGNPHFTEQAVLKLILACPKLEHLDIYDNPNFTDSGKKTLVDISKERKLAVILRGLTDKSVAAEDPSLMLNVWKAGMV